ncbi:Fic family protein [Peptococcus niger]|uniref:Fic family protein n=1 Tax=Peptococcus niger TaxID=2741 RepID=A0A1G6RN61_PEPNI|nr:Fic family protein [Peptococcus niger]SDD05871.1 Fic family protein [Peptococcus niger]
MEYLFKKWYKTEEKSGVEDLYLERFNSPVSVKTGLTILPMNSSETFELFYTPTNDMMLKIDEIFQNDTLMKFYDERLPEVAKKNFLLSLIVEELQSTNQIEGVKSSRQEIASSARRVMEGVAPSKTRMGSMIHSYLELWYGELSLPDSAKDVRKIYDFITDGEISASNLPDGQVFIKDGSEIRNSVGRVIHKGVGSEKRIIDHVSQLLNFLNHADLPYLVRLAIGHYYFGYIHPFYDGNGRTSRFITSLYLSKAFSVYTAYAFSNGCRIMEKRYLDLFANTNRFNSYGEMNFAIDSFLDILLEGQAFVNENLQDKERLLNQADACIKMDERLMNNELAQNIVFVLCQALLFNDSGLERRELEDIIKAPKQKLHETLSWLEKDGYIYRVQKRPIVYVLNEKFLEKDCQML